MGQKVGFRFIIAGVYGAPKINPFNQEGDVKFVSRAVTIGANHVRRTREFIILWILFLLIPRAFDILPSGLGGLGDMAAGSVRVALLFMLIPRVESVGRVIELALERLAAKPQPHVSVTAGEFSDLIVLHESVAGNISREPRERN